MWTMPLPRLPSVLKRRAGSLVLTQSFVVLISVHVPMDSSVAMAIPADLRPMGLSTKYFAVMYFSGSIASGRERKISSMYIPILVFPLSFVLPNSVFLLDQCPAQLLLSYGPAKLLHEHEHCSLWGYNPPLRDDYIDILGGRHVEGRVGHIHALQFSQFVRGDDL